MGTELTLFDAPVPAAIQEAFGDLGNIPARQTVPQLSFRGKVWRVIVNGEETIVKNKEGDPVQSVRVVVLKLNDKRSRAYFPGAYEEGKSQQPTCWSNDGVTPDASIAQPEHPTCAGCPQAAKGAKITDAGKAIAACGQFRRIAIVPTANIQHEPLLLKIPQTSIWDKDNKENEEKGFYAFDQYLDFLRRRGVTHTGSVMTKIKFDARTSYPKLLFGADNWTPTEWHPVIKTLIDDPRLEPLINSLTEAQTTTSAAPATPAPTPTAPPVISKSVPPPSLTGKKAPTPPKTGKAAPPPADPDDEAVMPSPAAKGNGKKPPATIDAKTGEVEDDAGTTAADKAGLGTLLNGWD